MHRHPPVVEVTLSFRHGSMPVGVRIGKKAPEVRRRES
ncbi:hypothetical protein GA0074695_1585 [Micromonospora viridifaciens]|uniref:Uncharacterized protein n=1 Tax=Micromonospora viridifaciens TaxID=1881 RepID=A0A1C4VMC2_MICVI|nr:hypothetical protein GA0074695_1585 [Micromonospora viridifaciens]